MTKTDAAKALDVTRATVYSMIRDGRLVENGWRKVTTQSIIDLITKGKAPARKTRGKNLRMSADKQ